MVVPLDAMPKTQLWDRLQHRGAPATAWSGDLFGVPNFQTRPPARTLVEGYRRILTTLYAPEAFYERLYRTIDTVAYPRPIVMGGLTWEYGGVTSR